MNERQLKKAVTAVATIELAGALLATALLFAGGWATVASAIIGCIGLTATGVFLLGLHSRRFQEKVIDWLSHLEVDDGSD